jgi:hypothetical protein
MSSSIDWGCSRTYVPIMISRDLGDPVSEQAYATKPLRLDPRGPKIRFITVVV